MNKVLDFITVSKTKDVWIIKRNSSNSKVYESADKPRDVDMILLNIPDNDVRKLRRLAIKEVMVFSGK
jgi:hypothetical protein